MLKQLRHRVLKYANVAVVKGKTDKPAFMAGTHRGYEGGYANATEPALSKPCHLLRESDRCNAELVRILRDLSDTVVHQYQWHVT